MLHAQKRIWSRTLLRFLLMVSAAVFTAPLFTVAAPQAPQRPPAAQPQRPPAAAQRPTTNRRPATKSDKDIPPPEEITGRQLATSDGVMLQATFYPGTNGKDSVPVLLLHNWKSSRKEFAVLAPYLQERLGCAVLVPDLRGHGESTTKIEVYRGRPKETKVDASRFRTNDFAAIAKLDMGALRRFLVEKNNNEELNLNKLVIVGSEMGAGIGTVWAAYDWNVPNYEHAGIKQGQDVKALVLISPKLSYSGLDTSKILSAPGFSPVRDRLSVMILAGKKGDSRRLRDIERIEAKLMLNRPEPEEPIDRTVLYFPFDTSEQAGELLNYRPFNLPNFIARFIEERVIKGEPDAAWMKHR